MASGFLAALAGAVGGVGRGMQKNVEISVEDRRQAKRDQLAADMQKSNQDFLAGQNAAQIASQEKMTKAQQETSLKLGQLSSETTKAVTGAEIGSREKLSREQIDARMKELEKSTDSAERIAKMDVDSRKSIADLQIEAAQQLGITEKMDSKGNVILMRPDGTRVEGPKDKDGNEISLAASDTDTDDMKNIKYLITAGVDPTKAQDMVLGPKNADPKLERLALFRAMVGNTLVPPTEDELQTKWELAGTFQAKMDADAAAAAPTEAPAAPAAPAPPAAPAVPAAAAQTMTPAQKQATIEAAKRAVQPKSESNPGGGKDKAAVAAALKAVGIAPAEAGL